MRALLPVYCRPLGYFIIALALFLPFIFLLWGKVTDANLLFYKECSKLLMMMGALMIIFALTKNGQKDGIARGLVAHLLYLLILVLRQGKDYHQCPHHHSSGVVPSFHIPIVGKSDRCQLAVLQGMLQTPDDDGGTDNVLLPKELSLCHNIMKKAPFPS